MKKIFTIIAAVALFISCDESKETVDSLSFPADAFVALESSSVSVLESNGGTIDVKLNLSNSKEAATSPTSVSFTIASDNAVEGVHYTVVNGKTSFDLDAGVFSDVLQIVPIDNTDEDGDKVITITLNTAPVTVGFPGPDGLGKVMTLTLQDDDCAFSLAGLGAAAWGGQDNVPASQAGPNDTVVETSFDGTDLLMEGLGYPWMTDTGFWDEVVVTSHKVKVNVDLVTGAIDIPLQDMCTTTWNGAVQDDYTIDANGVYTSCSETMVINYNIYQGGSTTALRSFTETITKK